MAICRGLSCDTLPVELSKNQRYHIPWSSVICSALPCKAIAGATRASPGMIAVPVSKSHTCCCPESSACGCIYRRAGGTGQSCVCGYHGRALSQVRIPVVTVCLVMESDCDAWKAGSLKVRQLREMQPLL